MKNRQSTDIASTRRYTFLCIYKSIALKYLTFFQQNTKTHISQFPQRPNILSQVKEPKIHGTLSSPPPQPTLKSKRDSCFVVVPTSGGECSMTVHTISRSFNSRDWEPTNILKTDGHVSNLNTLWAPPDQGLG